MCGRLVGMDPTATIQHIIAVDDDYGEVKSICSCGKMIYEGTNRDKKMAESYRHLAEVLDPPAAVMV